MIEDEEELVLLGSKCNFGDTAYVVHTGEYWIMDSKSTWYPLSNKNKNPVECNCVEEMTIWAELEE